MAVYTVFHERLDTAENTRKLVDRLKFPFPAVYDGKKALHESCGVTFMPQAFLVSHTGKTLWRGGMMVGEIEKQLAQR